MSNLRSFENFGADDPMYKYTIYIDDIVHDVWPVDFENIFFRPKYPDPGGIMNIFSAMIYRCELKVLGFDYLF